MRIAALGSYGIGSYVDAVNRASEQAATLAPQFEVEAPRGAVVRRGVKFGVPTPIHRTIVACLSVHQPFTATTQYTQPHSTVPAEATLLVAGYSATATHGGET
jgi:hypothetical protein